MKSSLICLILASILISSCTQDIGTLPTLDLDNPKGHTDINISDLVEDIRLLKLEMIEGEPLPQNAFQWIGEKHLLYFGRDKVYQYTADGSFVRVLMKRGQGPGEFSYVMAYDIDENKDLLYWSNQGTTGKIFVTDLVSGQHLDPIKLPYDTRLAFNSLRKIDEDTFLCFSNKSSEEDIMFYYFTLGGATEEGLPRYNKDIASSGRGAFLKLNHKSGKYNYLGDVDTLYSIDGNTLEPVFSMLVSDRFNYGDNLEGHLLSIRHLGSKYAIMSKSMLVVTTNENSTTMNSEDAGTFLCDMQDFSLSTLDSWIIDYLAYTTDDLYFITTDNYGIIKFSALELKSICEESLLKNNINPETRSRLKALNESITENDNPYFLVGRII